jgi:hypothetical protein
MSEQPEALRLPEELRRHSRKLGAPCGDTPHVMCAAADAMDALLALCEEMGGALNAFRTANGANNFNGWNSGFDDAIFKARIALAKWEESK